MGTRTENHLCLGPSQPGQTKGWRTPLDRYPAICYYSCDGTHRNSLLRVLSDRLYAARVAARIRRELNADVDMIQGRHGVFKVVVDGDTVIDGGAGAFLGIMPSQAKILGAVRQRVAR